MISKTFLEKILGDSIAIITFTKVDGTERVMKCTRDARHIQYSGAGSTREVNEDVLPVWDLDNQGWRSFRVDSVTNVSDVNG